MSLQEAAALLIDDQGRPATLRRVTEGSYVPATGTAANTTADYPVMVLLLNYTDFQRQDGLIEAGDRKAVIKAQDLSVVPDIQDLLIVEAKELRIVNVRQVEQSGQDVIYICQVRS